MSELPTDLRYTESHEWVRRNDDGTVDVGVTDHAQQLLGDLVYVELPEAGRRLQAREACAVVESVKAASDVYAPVAGEVVDSNSELADAPERVNGEPYGDGWLFRIRPNEGADVDALLDAEGYRALIAD
jgi:glycine cleavage system H protein